jgi:hypothetical protein
MRFLVFDKQVLKGRVRETAGFPNEIGQGGVYAVARKIGD